MIKKNLIILIVCLFSLNTVISQESQYREIDSSFQYLYDKFYEFKPIDSLKTLNYANTFYAKALREKDTVRAVVGMVFKAEILKKDSLAINYMDSMINLTKNSPNKLYPAHFHQKKFRYFFSKGINNEEATKEILIAKDYAESTNNDSLKYLYLSRAGIMMNRTGKVEKALEMYLECYKYYKVHPKKISDNNYYSLLHNISSRFSENSQLDSALYYNDLSIKFGIEKEDDIYTSYAYFVRSGIYYRTKEYKKALENGKKSINGLISDENYPVLSSAYALIARSYLKLENDDQALFYFRKVDSIHSVNQVFYYSNYQRITFKYLYEFHKKQQDLEKQLYYLNKVIAWDSIRSRSTKKISKNFYEKYEKPILKERELLMSQPEQKVKKANQTKYILIFSLTLILGILTLQWRRQKKLKAQFKKVLEDAKKKSTPLIDNAKDHEIDVPKEVIKRVSNNLVNFENNLGFIEPSLSLSKLAEQLDTNSNYLSKIINHHKRMNFSSYVNDLRIGHTLKLLDSDHKIRRYSVKGIAQEVGYKNAESFSNAFYKKTGLKPSYYIKQLEKLES